MRKYFIFFIITLLSLSTLAQEQSSTSQPSTEEPDSKKGKKKKSKDKPAKEEKVKKEKVKKEKTPKEKKEKPEKPKKEKPVYPSIYTPTLGIGAGVLTYFGEISKNYKANNPITSRIAYDIQFNQPINSAFNVTFFGWRGIIEANERSLARNLNFQSTLSGAGIQLQYNFDHLLKNKDRIIEPYLGLGVEAFEFLSKTDLRDQFGNDYYYWEDGSIRNLPENDPEAASSIRLQRDYDFESDIRELNLDGFGDYDEFALAVPISLGVNMKLTERWNFKIGATYHYTFTDYLDGITEDGEGDRKGDSQSDNLLYASGSIHYNLTRPRSDLEDPIEDNSPLGIDDDEDEDGDGVIDLLDNCLGTPIDAEVDEFGCPLDGDKDNVGDYKDDEPNSAPNAIVDSVGVTYTDARIEEMYLKFIDSTGVYSPIERVDSTTTIAANKTPRIVNARKKTYAYKIGEYEGEVPSEDISAILSIPNVRTVEQGDKTVLLLDKIDDLPEAIRKKYKIEKEFNIDVGIVSEDAKGNIKSIDGEKGDTKQIVSINTDKLDPSKKDDQSNTGILYRIQLGAFTQKANAAIFEGIPNLISIKSDDGYTRYYSGSHNNYNDAAKQKIDIIEKGFEDAFVVALKNGEKIPLSEAGATIENSKKNKTTSGNSPAPGTKLSPEERKQLKFRVQLGSYTQKVPTDILEKYMLLGNIERKDAGGGVTKYVAGSFDTYQEAIDFRKELLEKGYEGAFVVGQYKGELMPAGQAKDLAK